METSVHALVPHPTEATAPDVRFVASAALDRSELRLAFVLCGDLATLALPAPAAVPEGRDRLWEHTCFEAFAGGSTGDAYLELNLSPSGDFALWSFTAYRRDMRPVALASAPCLAVEREASRLEIRAGLARAVLEEKLGAPPYRIALTAVVEDAHDRRSFWAIRHGGARPDFHLAADRALVVYPPEPA